MQKATSKPKTIQKEKTNPKVKIFIYGATGLIILGLVSIVFSAIFFLSDNSEQTTNPTADDNNKIITENNTQQNPNLFVTKAPQRQKIMHPPISFIDPQLGKQDAPITIIEYSDFNCAYCAQVQQTLAQLFIKYPNQIRLVWKSLPIKQLHATAEVAASAALCAGEQDKFWEYHDLLFENQDYFTNDMLINFAKELGLNTDNFSNCLANETMMPRIKKTIQEAEDLNITGTPHFYINQQEIPGAADLDEFERIIEVELGE
ncbi:MAG: thioredoxin domain-containing protein [bacterium]